MKCIVLKPSYIQGFLCNFKIERDISISLLSGKIGLGHPVEPALNQNPLSKFTKNLLPAGRKRDFTVDALKSLTFKTLMLNILVVFEHFPKSIHLIQGFCFSCVFSCFFLN